MSRFGSIRPASGPRGPSGVGPSLRATGAGCVAILLWSSLAALTVGAKGIPPFELLALTLGTAFVAGMIAQVARGRAALRAIWQGPAPWLCAFAGIFLYHALYFYAYATIPAVQANLLNYLWPLFFVLLAAAMPGAGWLRPRHIGGALLGLSGTVLLMFGNGSGEAGTGSLPGYLAAGAAPLVWASYSVLNRRFAATSADALVGVCGAVALAGALCHLGLEGKSVVPTPTQALCVIGMGLGPNGLAFFAWDYATKRGDVPLLGAASYLTPILSTLLLVASGAAQLTGATLASALLVVGGATLAAGGLVRRAKGRS